MKRKNFLNFISIYLILLIFSFLVFFIVSIKAEVNKFTNTIDLNTGSLNNSNTNKIDAKKWKLIEIKGAIDPAITDFIVYELKNVEDYNTIVIKMNTPGGLLDSMQNIVEAILNCKVPVIVWVGPSGATAASAGTFITLASDVATMAPATMIGAASPVSLMGGSNSKEADKTMEKKIMNFSVTYIKMLANKHGRNAKWAELAVTEAASLSSEEALKNKVIDYIAKNLEDLKVKIDKKEIKKGNNIFVFNKNNIVIENKKTPFNVVLRHILSNPNIAYIFLTLGVLAFIYEFSTPGVGFGLISGIVFLSLAFYSLSVLPVNYAGVILFLLGAVMIFLDITIPSHGLLTIGGVIIMFLGSNFLIKSINPIFKVSTPVIIAVTGSFALFTAFVIKKLFDLRKKKAITGDIGIKGLEGVVKKWDDEDKIIFVRGEFWLAESNDELKTNDKVIVIDKKGNKLIVKKQ